LYGVDFAVFGLDFALMNGRARERERGGKRTGGGWRAVSRQNPKLVINLGAKCTKLIPIFS
jgi:SLT domain-containing protein